MPVRRGSSRLGAPSRASESFDLVITGRAWVAGRLRAVEIGVDEQGRIGLVARSVRSSGARVDLGEAVLLPSATDVHVHFRDPGGPDPAETFESGTEGAALGGVGAVVDMPNTEPTVTDRQRWEGKAGRARGRLAVDVVLFGAAESPRAVRSLAPVAGGLKLYLGPTTGTESEWDPASVREVLAAASATDLPMSVHAEWAPAFGTSADPPSSTEDWNRLRPPASETEAVKLLLPASPHLRLHVAHTTLASTVDRLASEYVSCEATPHHLLLHAASGDDAYRKTNPPLRTEADRAALWARFAAGAVPMLASDHAPHHGDSKDRSFALAPSGVPGVETMLPLFLELVRAGRLPLPVLTAAAMDRPARWLGLPQGRLAAGHRANFIAVDFRRRGRVAAARLRSGAGWSPFEGWATIVPTWHFRDGIPIVEKGELVGGHPGRVVRPEYLSPRAARAL